VISTTSYTPRQYCLYCLSKLDAATLFGSLGLPEPGDATICMYCGGVHIFGPELLLRKPSDEEARELQASPDYRLLQDAADKVVQKAAKPKVN
jgi:hypothetical protein